MVRFRFVRIGISEFECCCERESAAAKMGSHSDGAAFKQFGHLVDRSVFEANQCNDLGLTRWEFANRDEQCIIAYDEFLGADRTSIETKQRACLGTDSAVSTNASLQHDLAHPGAGLFICRNTIPSSMGRFERILYEFFSYIASAGQRERQAHQRRVLRSIDRVERRDDMVTLYFGHHDGGRIAGHTHYTRKQPDLITRTAMLLRLDRRELVACHSAGDFLANLEGSSGRR